jgi:hypothetical protein
MVNFLTHIGQKMNVTISGIRSESVTVTDENSMGISQLEVNTNIVKLIQNSFLAEFVTNLKPFYFLCVKLFTTHKIRKIRNWDEHLKYSNWALFP